jgi:hypothetical protein
MTRFLCLIAALVLFAVLSPPTIAADFDNCIAATCRITCPDGSAGTGCVFEVGQGYAYVLTANHVVETASQVGCEFWSEGHQSSKMLGQVAKRSLRADSAIVAIRLESFGGRVPPAIPLASRDYRAAQGSTLVSVGCSNGSWATGWKGHALGYDGNDLRFIPVPANGRSGSAIFDADGTHIVAVLRARTGESADSHGIGTAIHAVYGAFDTNTSVELAQCGPQGCPQPRQPQGRGGIIGIRGPQGGVIGIEGATPWPTLPQQAAPVAPPVDLSPINQTLDAIAQQINQRQAEATAEAPPVPIAPQPVADPRVDQALQSAGQANQKVDALATDTANGFKTVAGKIGEVGEAIDKVQKVVAPLSALRDKLEADAEAGGLKGKVAQRILDKLEGGESGDGSLRKVLITGGIVLGAVLLIGIAVIHTMRTGKGPANDIIEKLVARHPDNEKLQAIHAKIDALDAKLYRGGNGAKELASDLAPHLAAGGFAAASGNLPGVAANAVGAGVDVFQQVKDYIEARLAPAPGQVAPAAATPVT